MKFIIGIIFTLLILGILSMTNSAQVNAKDEKAIKDVAFKFEKAWNGLISTTTYCTVSAGNIKFRQ